MGAVGSRLKRSLSKNISSTNLGLGVGVLSGFAWPARGEGRIREHAWLALEALRTAGRVLECAWLALVTLAGDR